MTDNQRAYEAAICGVAHVDDIGDVSDGFHTFNQLYYQRAMLFAALVNQNRNSSWKTRKHEDGEPCFGGGWFLVTIDTPEGAYGYHYEDKYWDLFHCKEIEKAKHWDGYTEKDVGRLMSLPNCFNCRWCHNNTKLYQDLLQCILIYGKDAWAIEILKELDPKKAEAWDRIHNKNKRKLYRCERCGAEWKCEYHANKFGKSHGPNDDPDILCQCCGFPTAKEVVLREMPEIMDDNENCTTCIHCNLLFNPPVCRINGESLPNPTGRFCNKYDKERI